MTAYSDWKNIYNNPVMQSGRRATEDTVWPWKWSRNRCQKWQCLSVSHYPNKAQLHKKQPKELTHINRRHNKHLNGEKNLSELQQVHMHTSGKPRVINRNLFSALK